MKKRVIVGLLISLVLTGCTHTALVSEETESSQWESAPVSSIRPGSGSVSRPGYDSEPVVVPSSSQAEKQLSDIDIFDALGIDPITYDEYFSKEVYIPNGSDSYASLYTPIDWQFSKFYLCVRSNPKDRVLLYEHPVWAEQAFLFSRYLLYFLAEGTLYRMFIPEQKVEAIYQDDDMTNFRPITNFVTMIYHPNPAFKEAMEIYGYEGMPRGHPAQYLYYLYDCRDGSLTEFHLSDIGYPEQRIIVTVPIEDIYPLPEE